ncbi:MAG TPA: hypothetical protein VKM94_07520 [Blastocatellia bacterium]|nr:hypothetical protein [Blastocatellia bacterium]
MRRRGRRIRLMRNSRSLPVISEGVELVDAEPDYIREVMSRALSSLSAEKRSYANNKLLSALRSAGLRVRESLLMIGVSARTTDDLTAPEVASLIRYVRLTKPSVIVAVGGSLKEIVTLAESETKVQGEAA